MVVVADWNGAEGWDGRSHIDDSIGTGAGDEDDDEGWLWVVGWGCSDPFVDGLVACWVMAWTAEMISLHNILHPEIKDVKLKWLYSYNM